MKTRIEKSQCSAPGNNCLPTRTIRTFLAADSSFLMALLARIVSKNQRVSIVGSATDGRKALCHASTLPLDLVVTDLHMPGMDGAEAARRLKQLPNPPIIFVVTGDDTPEARARSMAAGADAFLVRAGNLAPRLLCAIQEFFPDELAQNDAGRSLYLAEDALVQSGKAETRNLISLYKALGGGWETMEHPATAALAAETNNK